MCEHPAKKIINAKPGMQFVNARALFCSVSLSISRTSQRFTSTTMVIEEKYRKEYDVGVLF